MRENWIVNLKIVFVKLEKLLTRSQIPNLKHIIHSSISKVLDGCQKFSIGGKGNVSDVSQFAELGWGFKSGNRFCFLNLLFRQELGLFLWLVANKFVPVLG